MPYPTGTRGDARRRKTWTQVTKVSGVLGIVYVSVVRHSSAKPHATFDAHRQDDFETHIYASNDFGRALSIAANLKGEIARTLTEDLRNPGVSTRNRDGAVSRSGQGWQRLKANLPTEWIGESRCTHATMPCSWPRTDAPSGPRQSRADSGPRGATAAAGEAVRAWPRSPAPRQAIATISSGAIRRSSARTRRRRSHLVVSQESGRASIEDRRRSR